MFDFKKKQSCPLVFINLILILMIYLSPFLFDWKVVFIGAIIYTIHLNIFGECAITVKMFADKNIKSFHGFLLSKLGFFPDPKILLWTLYYVVPWAILNIAVFWQLVFEQNPLIQLDCNLSLF